MEKKLEEAVDVFVACLKGDWDAGQESGVRTVLDIATAMQASSEVSQMIASLDLTIEKPDDALPDEAVDLILEKAKELGMEANPEDSPEMGQAIQCLTCGVYLTTMDDGRVAVVVPDDEVD